LYAHKTGRWAKKIRGKIHYFGKWDDPDGALAKFNEQWEDLRDGRTPRPDANETTVKDVANGFLEYKEDRVKQGELSPRTWDDYKIVADLAVETLGKRRKVSDLRPDDFLNLRNVMANRYGSYRLSKSVGCVRSMFKYAFESDLLTTPVRFGPAFKGPSKKTLRIERAKQGPKLFTREEIHRMLKKAGTHLRAMILLGVNCGFGNADCGKLPTSAVNLDTGWIDYPRPKTGVPRRCPLWPETIAAVREAIEDRPGGELVFLTVRGKSYAKDTADNPITKETAKLLHALKINGRKGLGFYTLRHVFRTVAGGSKDRDAANFIMGHESPHMSSVYIEEIEDDRLRAVTDHVREWLFGGKKRT
jgi:integrase